MKQVIFEKISKIDKPLSKVSKRNRGKTQTNKIRDEKEDIATSINEIQRSIRK
jgi:hypothetical protein